MVFWMHLLSYIIDIFFLFVFNLKPVGLVEEGKVACFLAGTTAMLKLRYSITKTKMQLEVRILLF